VPNTLTVLGFGAEKDSPQKLHCHPSLGCPLLSGVTMAAMGAAMRVPLVWTLHFCARACVRNSLASLVFTNVALVDTRAHSATHRVSSALVAGQVEMKLLRSWISCEMLTANPAIVLASLPAAPAAPAPPAAPIVEPPVALVRRCLSVGTTAIRPVSRGLAGTPP
jgi:hypothetical protein